jgi:pimeloyl-ACP methyl ester carboxylesterase
MEHLLLLHGAIGAADQLQPLAATLGNEYNIHTLSFSGHGGEAMPEDFSIARFADDVRSYMERNDLKSVSIFGYSMGGYVALHLAKQYPQRVHRVVTLATKFHWDEATAVKETGMLNADAIEQKLPKFAASLAKRHQPNNWKQVLGMTAEMLIAMGQDNPLKPDDYRELTLPVLLLLGDRDKMITLDETLAVYKSLPNAQMGMLPNTSHPIEAVNLDALGFMIRQFLQ